MASGSLPVPQDLVQAAHERNRLTELFRYFQSTSRAVQRTAINIDSSEVYKPTSARLSADPALNAFAQLGVLHLNCDRAFISLIDSENQHIISEATRSISLYEDNQEEPGDELALGEMPLDLFAGVCAGTMKTFTSYDGRYNLSTPNVFADQTRYVINDFTLEETYKNRPYVTGFPYMRYYAEVPLITSNGYVIGSYCVVDNKPREGLSEKGFKILKEIASTIMRHMGLIKISAEHALAGRLLDGLNAFVQEDKLLGNEDDSFGNPSRLELNEEFNTTADDGRAQENSVSHSTQPENSPPIDCEHTSTTEWSDNRIQDVSIASHSPSNPPGFAASAPSGDLENDEQTRRASNPEAILDVSLKEDRHWNSFSRSIPTKLDKTTVVSHIGENFQRASNILRQAMDLDGIAFLDAAHPAAVSQPQQPAARKLGYSIREEANRSENAASVDPFSLPNNVHQRILQKYPRGNVFTFTDEKNLCDELLSGQAIRVRSRDKEIHECSNRGSGTVSDCEIDSAFRMCFPGVRSLIFLPLWNPHKNQWFAGSVGWTINEKRVLSSNEFSYFSAFGNSVMAEVSRLELFATDLAKSDFISSISHELRSPLHGILGSAELLHGMSPTDDQSQMIDMIENCGRTLLDTMEQLLDYSKINNLKAKSAARQTSPLLKYADGVGSSTPEKYSVFDLSTIVEDTTEGMMAGHLFNSKSFLHFKSHSQLRKDYLNAQIGDQDSKDTSKLGPNVILNIEHTASWWIESEIGAWRRIILNLLGNALKYTDSGFIEITLRSDNATQAEPTHLVSLTVSDTGRGMSPDFLQNHLYKPYMQENSLSIGAGLGLSIIHKLVSVLGGRISIESDLGLGTKVTVSVPVGSAPTPSVDSENVLQWRDRLTLCLVAFDSRVQPGSKQGERSPVSSKAANTFKAAFTTQAKQWFHLDVVSVQETAAAKGDIIVIHERNLHLLKVEDLNGRESLQVPGKAYLLVVCDAMSSELQAQARKDPKVQYLAQPIGPQKMGKALSSWFRDSSETTDTSDKDNANCEKTSTNGSITESGRIEQDHPKYNPSSLRINLSERAQAPEDTTSQSSSTSTKPKESPLGRHLHLLLVDDNKINLKILTVYMKRLRCTYATASNGIEAVEKYKNSEQGFDYVLMDISMPIMNGFEATRHLRAFERERGIPATKVIALTGLGSAEAQEEALKSGVDLFLLKPVPMDRLRKIIEGTL